MLLKRFRSGGVIIEAGQGYHAPQPGRFRLLHSVEESALREGIRRLVSFSRLCMSVFYLGKDNAMLTKRCECRIKAVLDR